MNLKLQKMNVINQRKKARHSEMRLGGQEGTYN